MTQTRSTTDSGVHKLSQQMGADISKVINNTAYRATRTGVQDNVSQALSDVISNDEFLVSSTTLDGLRELNDHLSINNKETVIAQELQTIEDERHNLRIEYQRQEEQRDLYALGTSQYRQYDNALQQVDRKLRQLRQPGDESGTITGSAYARREAIGNDFSNARDNTRDLVDKAEQFIETTATEHNSIEMNGSSFDMRDHLIKPGATGTFRFTLCGPTGTETQPLAIGGVQYHAIQINQQSGNKQIVYINDTDLRIDPITGQLSFTGQLHTITSGVATPLILDEPYSFNLYPGAYIQGDQDITPTGGSRSGRAGQRIRLMKSTQITVHGNTQLDDSGGTLTELFDGVNMGAGGIVAAPSIQSRGTTRNFIEGSLFNRIDSNYERKKKEIITALFEQERFKDLVKADDRNQLIQHILDNTNDHATSTLAMNLSDSSLLNDFRHYFTTNRQSGVRTSLERQLRTNPSLFFESFVEDFFARQLGERITQSPAITELMNLTSDFSHNDPHFAHYVDDIAATLRTNGRDFQNNQRAIKLLTGGKAELDNLSSGGVSYNISTTVLTDTNRRRPGSGIETTIAIADAEPVTLRGSNIHELMSGILESTHLTDTSIKEPNIFKAHVAFHALKSVITIANGKHALREQEIAGAHPRQRRGVKVDAQGNIIAYEKTLSATHNRTTNNVFDEQQFNASGNYQQMIQQLHVLSYHTTRSLQESQHQLHQFDQERGGVLNKLGALESHSNYRTRTRRGIRSIRRRAKRERQVAFPIDFTSADGHATITGEFDGKNFRIKEPTENNATSSDKKAQQQAIAQEDEGKGAHEKIKPRKRLRRPRPFSKRKGKYKHLSALIEQYPNIAGAELEFLAYINRQMIDALPGNIYSQHPDQTGSVYLDADHNRYMTDYALGVAQYGDTDPSTIGSSRKLSDKEINELLSHPIFSGRLIKAASRKNRGKLVR